MNPVTISSSSVRDQLKHIWSLCARNQISEALAEVTHVLGQDPQNAEAFGMLGYCLAHKGKYNQGIAAIQQAIHLQPNRAFGYYMMSFAQGWQNNFIAAKEAIDKALEFEPKNSYFWLRFAEVIDDFLAQPLAVIDQQLPALNLGIDLPPTAEECHWILRQNIIDATDRVLDLEPLNTNAHYLRLRSLYARFQWADIESGCFKLLEISPNHAKTHNLLGIVHQHFERWAEAIQSYQTAIRLDPSHSATYSKNLVEVYIVLGLAYQCQQQWQESLEMFQSALQYQPNSVVVRQHLATTYHLQGAFYRQCRMWLESNEALQKAADLMSDLAKRSGGY
jgi:tetratricopeptide (TPR) repeat protein